MLLICVGLCWLVGWTFFPSLRDGFTSYDDDAYVTANAHVRYGLSWDSVKWAFQSCWTGNWHPLTWLSHMLDCQVFGLQPWGHHLTSVLLHVANTFLVFLALRQLTRAPWRSLGVAALFGLHPLRVESVTWIAERKDVLSTAFWMLTLWAYARYVQGIPGAPRRETRTGNVPVRTESEPPSRHRSLYYSLALLFFVLGLMSKSMLVTVPFLLLVLDYWPLCRLDFSTLRSRPAMLVKLLLEKAPFFLLAGAASIAALVSQSAAGAFTPLNILPVTARMENALVSYCRYLGKLFYPLNLSVFYLHPRQWPAGTVLLAGLLLLGISIFVVALRRRHRYLLAGWLWFLGTLVPVIGLVQIGSQSMSDRYTYVPLMGMFIILVWGAHELTNGWRHQAVFLSAAAAGLALPCILLTRQQIGYWVDSETLFRHAIAIKDNNPIAHTNLGHALLDEERVDEAMTNFETALEMPPGDSDAYNGLGLALARKGQTDDAIACFQKALEARPGFFNAHYNLATELFERRQLDAAIVEFQKALEILPGHAKAHNNLGGAFLQKGQLDQAIVQYQLALQNDPGFVTAHNNLGAALSEKGRLDEAIAQYRMVLESQPDFVEAHYNLGVALFRKGRLDEAIVHFQKTLEIQPSNAEAHCNLGNLLLLKGRTNEAVAHLQRALEIRPDLNEARQPLARLMSRDTRPPDTIAPGQTDAPPAPNPP